ncbi:hypothetical protein TBH_C2256 [Thiolapillus brandeum]|uniref:Uncharacterized protein n=2 Tax=Thiolapillus brandeum TaxID=1076588 RepID=A0A7U6GK52_9GAMM|nr:hypothetical protein TBH_C2256 [Thiolapillus brandeum]
MSMRKPSREEMEQALQLAEALREKGKDQYKLGYVLLYLQERNKILEDLRKKAEYYVRFGMGEQELRNLRSALEKIHDMDVDEADDSSFFVRE